MKEDVVFCGYIKVKFPIDNRFKLGQQDAVKYAQLWKSCRITGNFAYIGLGHTDIRDNHDARKILKRARALKGKVTRLDFFVDSEMEFDLMQYYEALRSIYEDNHVGTQLATPSLLTSPGGETVYVGKRSSARMLRVYDKRKEVLARRKVDIGYNLIRYELEVKRTLVPYYRALFLQYDTQTILEDIASRYHLPHLAQNALRYIPDVDRALQSPAMAFVSRFSKILSRAWLENKCAFCEEVGIKTC